MNRLVHIGGTSANLSMNLVESNTRIMDESGLSQDHAERYFSCGVRIVRVHVVTVQPAALLRIGFT